MRAFALGFAAPRAARFAVGAGVRRAPPLEQLGLRALRPRV